MIDGLVWNFPQSLWLEPWVSIYTDLDDQVHQFITIGDILKIDNTKDYKDLFQMTKEDLYSLYLQLNAEKTSLWA